MRAYDTQLMGVHDTHLFIQLATEGVLAIDVSILAHPSGARFLRTLGYANHVEFVENEAYVATGGYGTVHFDLGLLPPCSHPDRTSPILPFQLAVLRGDPTPAVAQHGPEVNGRAGRQVGGGRQAVETLVSRSSSARPACACTRVPAVASQDTRIDSRRSRKDCVAGSKAR